MKLFPLVAAAVAALLSLSAAPAAAVPLAPAAAAEPVVASIPFDPPLGQELRYRSEETVEKDGTSHTSWDLASYRFDRAGEGYTLTVSPISSGSTDSDPLRKAVEKRLAELSRRPYVLTLDGEGVITGLVQADAYWDAILSALEQAVVETRGAAAAGAAEAEAVRVALGNVLKIMRAMPAQTRLAVLSEDVQPLVEFAGTETTVGEPVETQMELPSPMGGTVKTNIRIALNGVKDDIAHITVRGSVPRSELEAASARVVAGVAAGGAGEGAAAEAPRLLAKLDRFSREAVSDFHVSLVDGTLLSFRSTDTVEVVAGAVSRRQVTTKTMQRAD